MPRDGSGIYTTPAGTTAVPDTTIESAKYNANVADVAADLNAARPIVAGGTGGNSVTTARSNLQAERSGQQVTNFDTHVFENGSFWATSTATNAPAGLDVVGTAIIHGDPNYVTLHARAILDATNRTFVRYKKGGTWDATWTVAANTEADYVNATGDTMTGDLTIIKASPILTLSKAASGQSNVVQGTMAGAARWWLRLGNDEPESGSNAGSNLDILRWSDTGAYLGGAFSINRSTGNVTINNALTVSANLSVATGAIVHAGGLTVSAGGLVSDTIQAGVWLMTGDASSGLLYFTNTATKYIQWTGTQFNIVGGPVNINGADLSANIIRSVNGLVYSRAPAGGYSHFRLEADDGTLRHTIYWDRTNNNLVLQNTYGNKAMQLSPGGIVQLADGLESKSGQSGAYNGYPINFCWNTAAMEVWVQNTYLGTISLVSDYRIKKDVIDLPGMWDTVKALRPIKYTQAEYTPQIEKAFALKQAAKEALLREDMPDEISKDLKPAEQVGPMFAADDTERWGFIAHEVQGALLPSAANGAKDQADAVQSLNLAPIVASLTKALQEAMARIEALEAAAAVPAR